MFERGAWLGQVRLASGPRRRLGTTAITDTDGDTIRSVQAAVLEFWGPMCAPCLQYKPVFDDVASRTSKDVLMASVNVDEAPGLMGIYGIQVTPTTLFLSSGSEVNRVEGKMTKEDLQAAITSAFGPSAIPQTSTPLTTPTPTPTQPTAVPLRAAASPAVPVPAPAAAPASGPSSRTLIIGGLTVTAVVVGVALIVGR